MAKVIVFNQVSLDGYFVDDGGDMSWAHKNDAEWNAYAAENASGGGVLLFGRITYEMMASFWPSPAARQMNATVADQMNALSKVVFSRTLEAATWKNTRLIKSDIEAEVRRMKREGGRDMVVMGSGTIVSQLTQAGLVDRFDVVVNPLILGKGRSMFDGVSKKAELVLKNTRVFKNGNVVLSYEA
jgi:dihydrofolate reductase